MVRALALGLAALALSPPSHVTVTADGRVGPLRVDRSTRAEVVAFAGRPDSEVVGRYDSAPRFDALGYSCKGRRATDRNGAPTCETVFYLDVRSGRLALLWTEDPRYANRYGIRVGTPTGSVEKDLHRVVRAGCLAQVRVSTSHGFIDVLFGGGRVTALVVHSRTLNPGVLDCIDS